MYATKQQIKGYVAMTTTQHYTRQRIERQKELRQLAIDRFEREQSKLINKICKFLFEY